MSQKILVESDPHQTRVAVLENDRLTEVFVERLRHRGLVGNVYKGRVTRVLPGMQAAFVDIGLERDAFLYVSDVDARLETGIAPEDRDDEEPEREPEPGPSIDALLKAGQEVIVQVVKDPLPNKGARITSHVTLPGRYLVLLPTVRHFGISRRIEDPEEQTARPDQERRVEHPVLSNSTVAVRSDDSRLRVPAEPKEPPQRQAQRKVDTLGTPAQAESQSPETTHAIPTTISTMPRACGRRISSPNA